MEDPFISGLRADVRDALRAGRQDDYRELCLIYADHLEEIGRGDRAEVRRAKAETMRPPGIRWPHAADLGGLTDHQRAQVARATSRRVGVLSGTPGTGKTFCIGALVGGLLRFRGGSNVAVCAPTGKAAVRITQAVRAGNPHLSSGSARTIHALLEIGRNGHDGEGWEFQRNARNPLPYRFIIVDEASMLDTSLAASLLAACAPGTHVLFVGDPYQLPPVGSGAPFRDLIASRRVGCGQLTEIRRNAGAIVKGCTSIKDGKTPVTLRWGSAARTVEDNLTLAYAATPADQVATLRQILTDKTHAGQDIQVICAVNKGSMIARGPLNKEIQATANKRNGSPMSYWAGDKVICLKNGEYEGGTLDHSPMPGLRHNPYVANGEIGTVRTITGNATEVLFDDPPRLVRIPFRPQADAPEDGPDAPADDAPAGIASHFCLGYAITCHKSQGSQWPVVVVMLDASRGAEMVTNREWLYTAISRASERCYLVGTEATVAKMVRRTEAGKRRTRLVELLGAKG